MANEYLRRTPTSTGNRRVWTASLWYKMSSAGGFFGAGDGSSAGNSSHWWFNSDQLGYSNNDGTNYVTVLRKSRDFSSWSHYMVVVDTTKVEPYDRVVFYENGVRNEVDTTSGYTNPSRNAELSWINQLYAHHIGARNRAGANTFSTGEYCDFFFIDGQALTPDVFGFYKQGKGYISVGSTQATDFRPGQWVPKTPRVIKTEINRRGGFGVNGFYLPMNDSKNFGADFHGEPNSIITLNEKLPQPRVGVATTASVGLGYTDALRADPFAANLVLALPFVSGGLESGRGDYSHIIRNSGIAKTFIWNNGSVTSSIGNTGVYYGSGGNFPGGTVGISTSTDFKMDGSFTVESWFFSNNFNSTSGNHIVQYRNGQTGEDNWVLSQGSTGGASVRFLLRNDNGTNAADLDITNTGITTNQWYHFAGVYDHPNRRATVYLNGVAVGINTNVSWTRNNGSTLLIGSNDNVPTGSTGNRNINGYLQDLRIYKGVAKYTGGFDVPRPYTPVGIATWRAVPDTTANNFATLNPLIGAGVNAGDTVPALLSGNLYLDNANQTWAPATIGVSTGKWYAEFMCLNGVQGSNIGVSGDSIAFRNSQDFFNKVGVSYVRLASSSVTKQFTSTSFTSGSIGYTSGDIVGVTLDVTNKEIKFFKNNVGIFTDTTLSGFTTTNTHYYFTPFRTNDGSSGADWSDVVANFGQNPTFSGNTTAGTFTDSNGKGLFKYQPPSGFLALCEDNLPTPAISDPGKYFKTVLWTGSGSARSIVGVGFTPDLVWIKARNLGGSTSYSHNLYDSVRPTGFLLASNETSAEVYYSGYGLSAMNSDGFSIVGGGSLTNDTTGNYVAWCWRAGAGTTSTNTNGSITSVVSVNQDAGFSIVSYTGNSTSGATVGHGLGKAPSMVIVKARDAARGWNVYHQSLGNTKYIQLSSSAAAVTNSAWWNNTSPNSSTFTLGNDNDVNGSGIGRYIAYCWAEIEGFSKFGSFIGNGSSTDGPFVYCGFKPALILTKVNSAGYNWTIYDCSRSSYNPNTYVLFPNLSNTESQSLDHFDWLSNGFKIRGTSINPSGTEVFFAAFAESPFTTANAK